MDCLTPEFAMGFAVGAWFGFALASAAAFVALRAPRKEANDGR